MTFFKLFQLQRIGFLALVMSMVPEVTALELTREMFQGRDFKATRGHAQFALHKFKLDAPMVNALNFGIAKLIKAHETVFSPRKVGRNFNVRFRIFETFEDYQTYSRLRYKKNVTKGILGFFSPSAREIVTWKQQPHLKWRLVPTLLHESCHAIMDEMYGQLPFWMIEGSADWFGEAPAWLLKGNGLRNDQHMRWIRLDEMRRKSQLPRLQTYLLTKEYEDWDKMFKGNIGQGYDVGWSVFDFFIKADPNGQAMRFLGAVINDPKVQHARGRPGKMELEFAQAINRLWQGGIPLLEKGWHTWISMRAVESRKALQKFQQEQRAKQQKR
jgi:hypothetical protein